MDSNKIIDIVRRFNDALNSGNIEAMSALLTPDTVFENTYPSPDGTRYEGMAQVRAFWEQFFRGASMAHIEIEEIFAHTNRCVMRWIYRWVDAQGNAGHIRGVDVYRLRDGLIVEKLSYVKG
jgi:ketosteroid isomerase-like protein